MKKLQLRLDDLRVDSFATLADVADRGTVLANEAVSDSTCFQNICTCDPTQGESCDGAYTCVSCADTCEAPCGEWCTVNTDPPICP